MRFICWVNKSTDTHSENVIVVFPITTFVTYEFRKFNIYSRNIELMYQRHRMTVSSISKNSYSHIPPNRVPIFRFMGLCEGLNEVCIAVIELVLHL
jgi:hypothetical protein